MGKWILHVKGFMKLLFCDNSLKQLINFRGEVIRHFLAKGCEVVLVAPGSEIEIPFTGKIRHYAPELKRSGMNPMKDFSYFRFLSRVYKEESPDLVFHYTIKPNIYGSLAARLNSIKSISVITGLGYAFYHSDLRSIIARTLYRFAMRFPCRILVLNDENRRIVIERHIADPDRLILLNGGEGIDIQYFK